MLEQRRKLLFYRGCSLITTNNSIPGDGCPSWLPRMIPDQRVTIKMIKLHYQDWEHYLCLSLDSRSSCTREERNNMQLCHLVEWVRPYIAKGQPFTQHRLLDSLQYLITFLFSQRCRDEFCFLITVSAKLPLLLSSHLRVFRARIFCSLKSN